MEQPIDEMTATKAKHLLPGWYGMEGKIVCCKKITYETDKITYGIGHIDIYPRLKKQINAIMKTCCNSSDYTESKELRSMCICFNKRLNPP